MSASEAGGQAMQSHRVRLTGPALLAVLLAGCSSGSVDDSPSTGDGSSQVAGFDSDREGPAAAVEGAVEGGTVFMFSPYADEFGSLDPTESYYPGNLAVLSGLVTRSLTQYVFDPEQGSVVVVPDIATDTGTANADFTEWTFTIRDGVRFEDGSEVTAKEVAFGIKRSFDRDRFPNGPDYSNQFFLDGDKYQGPYLSGLDYPGVVVEGDTLTLKMSQPFPELPYWATWPAMGPIPERGSNPVTYRSHPLATGPYKVDEFTPGRSLTLVRNDQWDPATDPGRHAYPDRYVFRAGVPQEQIDATILGDTAQAQTSLGLANVRPSDYSEAQRSGRLTVGSNSCTVMFRPDFRDPHLADIRVRRAIAYAWPYHEVAKSRALFLAAEVFGGSILPPGFPGRREFNPLETAPGTTDPDRANALLRHAGYRPGEVELRWPYMTDEPASAAAMTAMRSAFEVAGFSAEPFGTTQAKFPGVNFDPDAPINLRAGQWCSDFLYGGQFFLPLFHSRSDRTGFFDEPAVNATIDRIRRLPIEEQPAAWGALDQRLMTKYHPAIVIGYGSNGVLHGTRINGVHLNPTVGPILPDIHVRRDK